METDFNWPVFCIVFTISMVYYLGKAWRDHLTGQPDRRVDE